METGVFCFDGLQMVPAAGVTPRGRAVAHGLFNLARRAIIELRRSGLTMAAVGRVRGTGPGVSFGRLIQELESDSRAG